MRKRLQLTILFLGEVVYGEPGVTRLKDIKELRAEAQRLVMALDAAVEEWQKGNSGHIKAGQNVTVSLDDLSVDQVELPVIRRLRG